MDANDGGGGSGEPSHLLRADGLADGGFFFQAVDETSGQAALPTQAPERQSPQPPGPSQQGRHNRAIADQLTLSCLQRVSFQDENPLACRQLRLGY